MDAVWASSGRGDGAEWTCRHVSELKREGGGKLVDSFTKLYWNGLFCLRVSGLRETVQFL
jgi:hypothetical protein